MTDIKPETELAAARIRVFVAVILLALVLILGYTQWQTQNLSALAFMGVVALIVIYRLAAALRGLRGMRSRCAEQERQADADRPR